MKKIVLAPIQNLPNTFQEVFDDVTKKIMGLLINDFKLMQINDGYFQHLTLSRLAKNAKLRSYKTHY